jgi:hypothetical protein
MSQLSFSDAEGQVRQKSVKLLVGKRFSIRWENFSPGKSREAPLSVTTATLCTVASRTRCLPLRIHCMYLFYNLNDSAMEDTLNEVQPMTNSPVLPLPGKSGIGASIRTPADCILWRVQQPSAC